jgi:predicted nucleic acid-binding protein
MKLVLDTSVIIAVITNEAHKPRLVAASRGAELIAPSSVHWEVGNAFSAMFKQGRISLKDATAALRAYAEIPIQFHEVELAGALGLCDQYKLYAYDAYLIECALKARATLLTLDSGLAAAAVKAGARVQEVEI